MYQIFTVLEVNQWVIAGEEAQTLAQPSATETTGPATAILPLLLLNRVPGNNSRRVGA